MPPLLLISFWSSIKSITGCAESADISVEWALSSPKTFRAYSITAACMPDRCPREYPLRVHTGPLQACLQNRGRQSRAPQYTVQPFDLLAHFASAQTFRVDPLEFHLAFVFRTCMDEGFDNGFVGIFQFHIFPDQPDRSSLLGYSSLLRNSFQFFGV